MAEIKKLLDDAIETEINNLNSASDKDEKSEVIKNLAALQMIRLYKHFSTISTNQMNPKSIGHAITLKRLAFRDGRHGR